MANKWEDLQITKEELNNIETALKDKEFRKLLVDYCEEINDPANKKIYQEEITQLEKERGNDVIFIEPKEGYVIKTSLDGSKLAFINICSNDNVQRPTSETTEQNGSFGSNWRVPHLISPPREDLNKKSKRCTVYDVIFHPEALIFASRNKKFRELINNIACDAIESNYSVNLDKTNLKFPKMKFKGMSRPLVIRKKVGESPKLDSDDPIDKIYSDIYDQMDTKITKPKTPQSSKGSQTTQKSKYTTPKYIIKHRTSVDLQDFTLGRTAHQNDAIPKELVIEIDLPLLKTSSDLNLDVSEKSVSLSSEKPAKYQLFLALPYAVCEERGSAKFDQDSRKLTITLPVLRRNLSLDNDSGVESDHVLSSCNSFEENSPLVSEIKEKFDYNLANLDKNLKFDDFVKNGAKTQNGGHPSQKVDPLSQNSGPISQKGSALTSKSKPSEKLVSHSGAKFDKSENGSHGSHISEKSSPLSQKEQNGAENVVKTQKGELIFQSSNQNGDHENQNGGHPSPNGDSAKQKGHPIQNCDPFTQNGENSKNKGNLFQNGGNQENVDCLSKNVGASSENSVCKSEKRTSLNLFLDPELHYSFPEFTCHTFNDIIVFTLRVKNVQNSSFEKVFSTESSVHLKFYSMSPSFVPIHYSVLLNFPECSKIAKDDFISEIWDNNLILQISFLSGAPTSYFIGSSESDLEEKFVEEPSNIYNNKINTKLDTSDENDVEKPNCEVMCTETNGVEIVLTKSDWDVSESEHSSPPNPKKLSHSYSESSCDEFSVSPTKGILKSRSRTPLSRSVSESSADDYTWSSFENFASVSDSLIPEEYEEHVSSSMKKTVRFNDVVSKQLFRTNSSILGQKKKNQRKSRNKKRAQERRLSESENSEAEDKVNKYLKKPSETDKVQIENENLTDKNDQKSSNDLIFDIDM